MSTTNKRSWKLQDFTAHQANVNCLALGHKSGRVLVTGGDDKKVNLWAIGKHSCFMSLSGHTTPIESVQFNHHEEQVCAGSRDGALKVWDLEAAQLVRTLSGHKYTVKSIDFHPYGEYLASGSGDSSIKMWDSRKKGCIITYNGHRSTVNSLKFSPDGNWIASGSEDYTVKIWDLRAGKIIREFTDHTNAVTSVQFHPHEFLLATGSLDQSVKLFDLETFNLVSEQNLSSGAVRSLWYHPEGECLFAGARNYLKVVGWEPSKVFDSLLVGWDRISDLSFANKQLIGASFHLTSVQVYVVDLSKVKPIGTGTWERENTPESPFSTNTPLRKSFSKAERPVSLKTKTVAIAKTIEESTSGTDPEEDSMATITNLTDYNEIFKGSRSLTRTPPPFPNTEEEVFIDQEPEHDYSDPSEPQPMHLTDRFETLSLDNNLNNYKNNTTTSLYSSTNYSRSKSNLDHVYLNRTNKQQSDTNSLQTNLNKTKTFVGSTPKFTLQRQSSVKEEREKPTGNGNIKHSSSEINISKSSVRTSTIQSRKNSFSRPTRKTSVPNVSSTRMPTVTVYNNSDKNSDTDKNYRNYRTLNNPAPVDIYVSSKISPDEPLSEPSDEDKVVPVAFDKPVGLDFDDFLPKNQQSFGQKQQLPEMSEAEVLGIIMRGHEPMMSMLFTRKKCLKLVCAQLLSKDMKAAMDTAIITGDLAVFVDLLGVINQTFAVWNLDLCVSVLPKLQDLLHSKFETYITVGCDTLKLILRHFGNVIKNSVNSPVGSFGVDISREERHRKSVKCHENLLEIQSYLERKRSAQGNVGTSLKEVTTLLKTTLD